ncbi:uncharacterized protein LOC116025809 [Ipomoea triloba]|uniref:uncharacterized protein LOC116025796 n=1 Tax=Ipomoea triloba TaxID=35885 RepID=UPI00125D24F8|nr:uncharacterized protein LOC116025796 [Ipomoea triloba]XP_031122999.1 uncharacterized protein LOC116025796 [Ipomoea triloba]XP_031123000.1 uncharacterized protein LOC116025796 [Ipomoea triloba]XP_031123008.1 uncharacterized protein LOC116025801 [Ipomoea triloba]XP_031123009.1 uncharacterized protein LOC116025801 [Ipomoea triloba]XP_031123010.1 uncharacterized protein LOC116025801 [Ipomoea triloba]XP_031123022.1 uncharacterized protein LOC116025809 [Ipomoea triloba]XP_031123023.1 uncharacte
MEDAINKSTDCFPSEQSSGYNYIFGDPELFPRVGTEYQAEIPPLLKKCGYRQLASEPCNSSIKLDTSDSYPMGLPIPVMWICDKSKDKRGELMEVSDNHVSASIGDGSENNVKGQVTRDNIDGGIKIDSLCNFVDNGEKAEGLQHVPSVVTGESINSDLTIFPGQKAHVDRWDGCYLVPGLPNEDWNDIEHSSFLLGLYIFGKNLSLVKRLIGSKETGDILSYYYGKFYSSRDYRRWSDCRKIKGRRCIYGQRIFMGWRQQELLSRLSSHVSEECLYMLAEISKLFGDGKMTLEEYVFSLKDKAGIKNLIEAVALGKGKKDLTGTALESTKANPSLPVRAEVPIGKACSSLTSSEIVKFLTGDFRLSKARSNDLFWEAVWPRLLARGWHSEQPSDVVYAGSKQSLVFLVPGVKKFSRRLEKGIHYFDSVTDVLNKVASEPGLLELEVNGENGGMQTEKGSIDPEMEEDQEVSLNPRRHSYLQPRNSTYKQHSMTFTVVDTSLYSGEGRVRVRELRSLPLGPLTSAPCALLSEESSSDSVKGDAIEPYDAVDVSHNELPNGPDSMIKEELSSLNDQLPNDPGSKVKEEESSSDKSANLCQAMQSMPSVNLESSPDVKPHQMTNLASISDFTALNFKDSSHNTGSVLIDDQLIGEKFDDSSFQDICPSAVGPSQSSLSGGSSGCNHEKTFERNLSENSHASGHWVENSSVVPKRSSPDQSLTMNVLHKCDKISGPKPSSPREANPHSETLESLNAGAIADEQPVMTSRRQSTRNRPSAKVLEAFAYGFLGTGNKRKGGDSSTSTASRRARRKTKISTPLDSVVVDNDSPGCQKEANMNDTRNENLAMIGESVNFVEREIQVSRHSDIITE